MPSRQIPHRHPAASPRLRWLAVGLCALAMLLMWGFVAVLQQGVERGERMRAEQLRAATQLPMKAPPRAAAPVKTAQAEQ